MSMPIRSDTEALFLRKFCETVFDDVHDPEQERQSLEHEIRSLQKALLASIRKLRLLENAGGPAQDPVAPLADFLRRTPAAVLDCNNGSIELLLEKASVSFSVVAADGFVYTGMPVYGFRAVLHTTGTVELAATFRTNLLDDWIYSVNSVFSGMSGGLWSRDTGRSNIGHPHSSNVRGGVLGGICQGDNRFLEDWSNRCRLHGGKSFGVAGFTPLLDRIVAWLTQVNLSDMYGTPLTPTLRCPLDDTVEYDVAESVRDADTLLDAVTSANAGDFDPDAVELRLSATYVRDIFTMAVASVRTALGTFARSFLWALCLRIAWTLYLYAHRRDLDRIKIKHPVVTNALLLDMLTYLAAAVDPSMLSSWAGGDLERLVPRIMMAPHALLLDLERGIASGYDAGELRWHIAEDGLLTRVSSRLMRMAPPLEATKAAA